MNGATKIYSGASKALTVELSAGREVGEERIVLRYKSHVDDLLSRQPVNLGLREKDLPKIKDPVLQVARALDEWLALGGQLRIVETVTGIRMRHGFQVTLASANGRPVTQVDWTAGTPGRQARKQAQRIIACVERYTSLIDRVAPELQAFAEDGAIASEDARTRVKMLKDVAQEIRSLTT